MAAALFLQFNPSNAGELVWYVPLTVLLTIFGLLPVCGILYVFYFLLTLPMRRNERTRVFLDLLELGLKEGNSPEKSILDAASNRDPELGARFHLLAAHLEKGMSLSAALAKVPSLIPPQLVAMLAAGDRIGDPSKVLPACRRFVNDGVSQVRGALNYLLIVTLLVSPLTIFVLIAINVLILPKFKEVFATMLEGAELPAFTQWVFNHDGAMGMIMAGFFVLVWIATLAYIGGPRLRRLIRHFSPEVPDRIAYWLPWRRKRLQRDFSAMLAVLLDSGVPETDAVALAAGATANVVVAQRAARVVALLGSGVKLPEAIRAMDDSGELQWRLANALQRGRGFLRALNGWHESLDAKAFQLEQAAAQTTTSSLVLFNGVIVAVIVIAMFFALISILNGVALW